MSSAEFGYLQGLVKSHAGLLLEPGKEYLAETRLLPVVERAGLDSIRDLLAVLRSRRPGILHREVVEAMTIKETSFFRDPRAFQVLASSILPDLISKRAVSRRLRIWCAACSSGQEPYSLAMLLLQEFSDLRSWEIALLATDLSESMVERARAGRFSQIEVNRGLPAASLVRWFRKRGLEWEIDPDVRSLVTFRALNLAEPFHGLESLDLVLMRNVLLYFDEEARRRVLDQTREILAPDGWLMLGAAETFLGLEGRFAHADLAGATLYRPLSG